jgi:hypothetical protein
MSCPSCASGTQSEFSTEMLIHLSGRKKLDHPGVIVLAKVSICRKCGSSQFKVEEHELALLNRLEAEPVPA